MKPCSDLNKLNSMCQRKIASLDSIVSRAITYSNVRERDMLICFVCIELLNLWSNFSREFYRSLYLEPKRISNGKIKCSSNFYHPSRKMLDIEDCIKFFKPHLHSRGGWSRRDEPTWHETNTILKLSNLGNLSNRNDIAGAFSLGSTVFTQLVVFRNYFAHRNESTRSKAIRIGTDNGIPSLNKNPTEILLSYPLGKTSRLLDEWINDISTTINLLCD